MLANRSLLRRISYVIRLFATQTEVSDIRVEHDGRLLGGDYYNEPGERKWNPKDSTLFFDFRILHSVEDVRTAVEKMGMEISAAHLTGALVRVRQLQEPVDLDFVRMLAERVALRKVDFGAKHFAAAWLALSRLEYNHPDFYNYLAEDSMKRNIIDAFSVVDLSNIIYGIGLLQKKHEQRMGLKLKPRRKGRRSDETIAFPLQHTLLETLVKETLLTAHPARLNEVQMTSTVYGLGLAKFRDLPMLEPLLTEATADERLWRYTEGELSNLLYGLVLMGMEKNKPVVVATVDEITKPERLKRVAEYEMTCLVYALRLIQFDGLPQLDNLRHELTHPERYKHLSEQSLSMITSNMRHLGMKNADVVGPLLKEIVSDRILPIIKPQGLAMGLYNYAASDFRDENVMEALVRTAMMQENVDQFTANDVSNVMFALGVLKYDDQEVLQPLKERLKDPMLVSMFEPGHMANVFHGGGKLKLTGSLPCSLEEIVKPGKLLKLSASQFVNVVYGLGRSDDVDTKLVDTLITQMMKMKRLAEFTSNQLASVVTSLGKMGYKNLNVLTDLMSEMVKPERLQGLSAIGLCSALHGLAGSEFRDGKLLGSFLSEVILPSRLREFDSAQLSIIMYAVGKIGIEDSRVIQPLLTEIMKDQHLSSMNMQGVTNVLSGLSQLHQFDEQVWERMTAEISKPERLDNMSALELSLVLHAYSLKVVKKPVLKKIVQRARSEYRLREFSTVGLASSLYSLAQLDLRDELCIEKMTETFCQPRHLSQVSPHHLANVVFSLGALNYKNENIMWLLSNEISKSHRLKGFSRHGLYNLLFGFARLQYRDDPLLRILWKEVLKIERLTGYTEREWSSIARSFAMLEFKNEDEMIMLRTKILTSRGLPLYVLPRPHSKHELTIEDVRHIREDHKQRLRKEAERADHAMQSKLPMQRTWVSEKNVVNTKTVDDRHKDANLVNWRDRGEDIAYQPGHDKRYHRNHQLIGPDLHPTPISEGSRRKPGKRARRQVMVFNQSKMVVSDDEFSMPPRRREPVRERIISPWSSPYYNLRAVQWPKNPGSSKVVNSDFDEPQHNPYQEADTESEEEFEIQDPMQMPPTPKPQYGPTSFSYLMKQQKRIVQKKDALALDELAYGLNDYLEKTK